MIPREWIEQAQVRLGSRVIVTPLRYDPELNVYLKLENRQITGSFKVRGALNKVLSLQEWEWQRGLVAASAGNHGQGVALAARELGARATVFASDHAVPAKLDAMRAFGADVRLVPGGYAEAEIAGLDFAQASGSTWVSPYNDAQIIAGQGTVGLELMQQLPANFEGACLVPAGGGGLVSGIGAALSGRQPKMRVIAVQPEASAFLHALFTRGSQENVPDLPSLADGLTGALEPGSVTIPLVNQYVDEFILVSEEEIARAVAYAWYHYREVIEGSAAVTLAAVLSGKAPQRPAVLIFSGGNIQPEEHARLIERYHPGAVEGIR